MNNPNLSPRATEVCQLLIAAGSDVGSRGEDGWTPLLSASDQGHTEVCQLLLTAGSDLEEKAHPTQFTPLHFAAINGHQSLLQLLLSHKANVNSRNGIGSTPLHLTSQEGHHSALHGGQFRSIFFGLDLNFSKSWQPCHNQGIVFLPLAVESLGAWHKSAIAEVKKLGSALARHTEEEETTTIKHLFQQLSISLVKGNAALLNNCNPGRIDDSDEGVGWG